MPACLGRPARPNTQTSAMEEPGSLHVEQKSVEQHSYEKLSVQHLPVDAVQPNPAQPRTVFDPDELEELTTSIRTVGVLQPIVVRPDGDSWQIVMGERRYRAAVAAGHDTVPVLVRPTESEDMLKIALIENLQRVQLNPIEEGSAYATFMSDFGCTQEELAEQLGVTRARVSHYLGMLRLPPAVQRRVAAGVLTAGHAKVLQSIKDPHVVVRLADRVVAESLSVRALEELIALGDLPGWEDDAEPKRRSRTKTEPQADLTSDAAKVLEQALETKIRFSGSDKRGRIIIEHAGPDDLRRIMNSLGLPLETFPPDEPTATRIEAT